MNEITDFLHSIRQNDKNDVVKAIQINALTLLEKSDAPHRRLETWKYTNLNNELKKEFKENNLKAHTDVQKDDNYYHLYFVNGIYDQTISDTTPLKVETEETLSLDQVLEVTQKTDIDFQDDFANKLANALTQSITFFTLDKNISIDRPIIIHHLTTKENVKNSHISIFKINQFSKLNVLETFHDLGDSLIAYSSYVYLNNCANFEHTFLQDFAHDTTFLPVHYSVLEKDSNYNQIYIHSGAGKSRALIHTELVGENATVHLNGLYTQKNNQHHDTLIKVHHKAPHTYGHQLYKGILNGQAKGIFTGKVYVDKEAQFIESTQLNKNLILSPKAHGFSRPQMEIYADDVKCSHGSTTGQISEEELFYFEARGINRDKARSMLANAFAYDVVLQIKNKLIQQFVKEFLGRKDIIQS